MVKLQGIQTDDEMCELTKLCRERTQRVTVLEQFCLPSVYRKANELRKRSVQKCPKHHFALTNILQDACGFRND
jgi:hypothetical protein